METTEQKATVAVGLGSNLGDRRRRLRSALDALETLEATSVRSISPLYQTEARIVEDQPAFLNACALVETSLAPRAFLDALLDIEREHGRERGTEKGPRTLDLDILLWEDRIVDEPGLRIPHPGLPDRAFVLVPLAEIAADAVDPKRGASIRDLLSSCSDDGRVERVDWQH